MTEYRTTDGNRIEVAANGHISTPKKVDLRSLGCPDWLASKVEGAREVRRAAPATPPSVTQETVDLMRRANRAIAKPLIAQTKREHPYDAPYSYASLRQHMETCASMTECAWSVADTVEDLLNSWPEDDENSRALKRDLHKKFRDAHREVYSSLEALSTRIAETMLHLSKVTNKVMSKGNGGDDN